MYRYSTGWANERCLPGHSVKILLTFGFAALVLPKAVDGLPFPDAAVGGAALNALQALVIVALTAAFWTDGLLVACRDLGLKGSLTRAAAFGTVVSAPMFLVLAVAGDVRAHTDVARAVVVAVTAPVAEELLFRGLLFGEQRRRADWGFWPAALLPAFLFAIAHLYQAHDATGAFAIFGVTALGSVWFTLLYARWDSLWFPISVHSLMNASWYAFPVGETAVGGRLPNAARMLTLGTAVVITLRWTERLNDA